MRAELFLLAWLAASSAQALDPAALPTGGSVTAGSASISQSANRLDVLQSSDRAILNWVTFNIGADARVHFQQPDAASVALNRVLAGGGASAIYGQLSATGQVFLINPSGVLFAPGSRVDVGGLVASTLDLGDGDFLAGRLVFIDGGNAGEVRNQGSLVARPGGYLALVGPRVFNEGLMQVEAGVIALAAGDRVRLDISGDDLIRVAVDKAALLALAQNGGLIRSPGGEVLMTARSAGDLLATAVNNTGVIEAHSFARRNGAIYLDGGDSGIVSNAGRLDASGRRAGETGGEIGVFGDKVALRAGSELDASGAAGGGRIRVGGDYQGLGPSRNAQAVYVDSAARLDASALHQGDGGQIVVWSDDRTRYYGTILARGGAAGGDGGQVEVSGKRTLDFAGAVDVGSAQGRGGLVLLDPQDILLNTSTQAAPPNNADGVADVAFADPPGAGTTTIQITDITGYSELFLQATNNITVAAPITMASGNSIRLEANNNLTVNASSSIATSGAGAITLKADADSSGAGTLALSSKLTAQTGGISLSGASISATSAATLTSKGAANSAGGNITINASGNISLAGAIDATGGTAAASQHGGVGGTSRSAG